MAVISVIVPVYKVEAYLRRCIDSILAQTFADFDLVLVDDGSPDLCGEMCDDYAKKDSRIIVIHKENGGLSDARNAGIEWALSHSSSEWITFIDSDDWIHADYLSFLLKAVNEKGVNISVCGFSRPTSEDECLGQKNDYSCEIIDPETFYCRDWVCSVVAWGKIYKKSAFQSIRFPVGKVHEDAFTTHLLMFKCERIVFIDRPLYYYFFNNSSITKGTWKINRLDILDAFSEQIEYFKANGFDKAYVTAKYRYLNRCLSCVYNLINSYPHEKKLIKNHQKLLKESLHDYLTLKDLPEDELCECLKYIHYKKEKRKKWIKRKIRHFKEYISELLKKR